MGTCESRLLLGFVCLPFCLSVGAEAPAADDAYRLVWQDSFDAGRLDEDRFWNIEVNGDGGGNQELQFYARENVSVGIEPLSGDSCLILTARFDEKAAHAVTSGRVNTKGKVCPTFGKIEARIKLPRTQDGLWPAFWLLGDDYSSVGWPRCGEIDIMEMGHVDGIKASTQDRLFNGACHWGVSHTRVNSLVRSRVSSYGLQDDGFHLFTLEWDENAIKMYLDRDKNPDAEPYYAIDIDDTSLPDARGNFFRKPFFIIFNLAVGGEFTGIYRLDGITALADGEARMYVDFVRVYQRNAGSILLRSEEMTQNN